MKAAYITVLFFFMLTDAFTQNRYDVVISEFMADPAPPTGLPSNEWIEIKNTSPVSINLQGWRIGDANSQSGPMPQFILHPDSFVIICSGSALAAMSSFATAVPVTSFPSLDNDGDRLFLLSANGLTMHAVSYSISWYRNELKKEGGWTLEMIDPKNPCAGYSNWKASVDVRGGTPGKKNSIDAVNNDQESPQLKYAYTIDPLTLILVFDEPVDSLKGATSINYNIDGGISITNAVTLAPLFNTVQLKLNSGLVPNTIYNLSVRDVIDCKNNVIGISVKTKTGLPVEASLSDLVINEILFNPKSNGFDYVEFYNRSNNIIDAARLYAANRNSSGQVNSIRQIFTTPFYIFPGDYLVITEDIASLQLNYLLLNKDVVVELSSMPSWPDDEGTVILLNGLGEVTDEVKYKDDWHFKLIENAEGVSLERIDPDAGSQDKTNWHSAASTAGYGTPGYKNSQYKQPLPIEAKIEVTPRIFSPDNDGRDDIATIQFQVTEPGFMANLTIYDAGGRAVCWLVKNATIGLNNHWNWDGLDEKGRNLPVGTYIILTEIFNLQGEKKQFKNTVVLARPL